MEKKLSKWSDLKKGMKFKVISNTSSHNYEVGKVYTAARAISNSSGTQANNIALEINGNYINIWDIEIISSIIKLEDIKEELEDLEKSYIKAKKELTSKIKFCKDNNIEEYNENEYKIYKVLFELDKDSTLVEKAKVISSLINS
jgi:hypothetical protein